MPGSYNGLASTRGQNEPATKAARSLSFFSFYNFSARARAAQDFSPGGRGLFVRTPQPAHAIFSERSGQRPHSRRGADRRPQRQDRLPAGDRISGSREEDRDEAGRG